MRLPIISDAEFLGATQLNAAASDVYNGVLEDIQVTHTPGLIDAAGLAFSASSMTLTVVCGGTFAGVFGNGFVGHPYGTTAGATSNTYTINLAPYVPSSGSVTVYIAAAGTNVSQEPFTVVGPPAGHPDFDPSFAPYIAYASSYNTLNIVATTTVPDNFSSLELARITLSAGQTSVLVSELSYAYQQAAGSILSNTGVAAATYTLLSGLVGADGRIYTASSATSINVSGTITSTAGNIVASGTGSIIQGHVVQSDTTGYLNIGTGSSAIGGILSVNGNSGSGGGYISVAAPSGYFYGVGFTTTAGGQITIGTGPSNIGGNLAVGGTLTAAAATISSGLTVDGNISVPTNAGIYVGTTSQTVIAETGITTPAISLSTGGVSAANGNIYGGSFTTVAGGEITVGTGASNIGGSLDVDGAFTAHSTATFNDGASITGALTMIGTGGYNGGWVAEGYGGAGGTALVTNVGIVAATYGFNATGGYYLNAEGIGAYGSYSGQFAFSSGSGNLQGVAFYATSDIRLKENLQPITPEDGRKFVKSVHPTSFDWRESGQHSTGYIAQELVARGYSHLTLALPDERVEEETHTYDNVEVTSMKGVKMIAKYDDTIAYLHAALLDAYNRIEALEAKMSGATFPS